MSKDNFSNIKLQLKLFNEIEKNVSQSQRSLSKELGVALGLANSLLKKFVKKGMLKISQAPMKRYKYYLTPKGFLEKAKLTSEYLRCSLDFFKKSKQLFETEFKNLKKEDYDEIILIGIGELTEIAILAANIQNVKISLILGISTKKKFFCGKKVLELKKEKIIFNARNIFVLCDTEKPQKTYDFIKKFKYKKIIVPNYLMVKN